MFSSLTTTSRKSRYPAPKERFLHQRRYAQCEFVWRDDERQKKSTWVREQYIEVFDLLKSSSNHNRFDIHGLKSSNRFYGWVWYNTKFDWARWWTLSFESFNWFMWRTRRLVWTPFSLTSCDIHKFFLRVRSEFLSYRTCQIIIGEAAKTTIRWNSMLNWTTVQQNKR